MPARGPAPLAFVRDDPALAAGNAARDAYTAAWQQTATDPQLTDLGKARKITAAWEQANTAIAAAARDLHDRQAARLAWLQQQVPIGPGIPDTVSGADRAVLHASWRQLFEQARNASQIDRQKMLTDAIRFGDDMATRAVLTAADGGDIRLVEQWANGDPERLAWLAEERQLQSAMTGFDSQWAQIALRPIPKPQQAWDLSRLESAAADTARFHGGQR